MNKYRDKSYFEINKAVAEKVGIIQHLYLAEFLGEVIWDVTSNDNYNGFISKKGLAFDPCNNPADAMPIIIDNKISLRAPSITDRWKAEFVDEYGNYVGYRRALNKNPYRAAMEVFLMMKDAENES
ncbi:DUF2591 family protein [Morganella morganii subsp. sibonii]